MSADLLAAICNDLNLASVPSCSYLSSEEFIDQNSRFLRKSPQAISIFHTNIRSLNANHAKLKLLLTVLDNPFDVIIVTEVCSYSIDFYSNLFPNFNFLYSLSTTSLVGGVGMYISNSVSFVNHLMPTPSCRSVLVESLAIEIIKNNTHFLIAGLYRHPSPSISQFNSYMEDLMLGFFNKFVGINCFLIGDTNINLLSYSKDKDTTGFVDILLNYGFSPYTLIPTRITANSSTLIDHIHWRQPFKSQTIDSGACLNGCLVTDISDHLANFICIPINGKKPIKKDRPMLRIFSESNKVKFKNEFSSLNWSDLVYEVQDVNQSYNNFSSMLKATFEKSFPLVKLSRSKAADKEWINDEVKKSCNLKSKYYKRWIFTKIPNDLAIYKLI